MDKKHVKRQLLKGVMESGKLLAVRNLAPAGGSSFNLVAKNLLFVDYRRSVEDLFAAGKYDQPNKFINSDVYPIPLSKEGIIEGVMVRLFSFPWSVCTSELLDRMERKKCRPATAHELLAFGAKCSNLQTQEPIIALDSILENDHGRFVLALQKLNGLAQRRAEHHLWRKKWPAGYHFMGIQQ